MMHERGKMCFTSNNASAVSDVELPMCAESNANELKQRL